MVLTLNKGLKDEFEKFIRIELLKTWTAQGHNMNGKVVREMDMIVKETSELISFMFYFLPYGTFVETGTPASKIPFSGTGNRGGKSAYIEGLIRYAEKKLRVRSLQEAKSAAFAIAYTQKKEGSPTRGSYKFSITGKRTGWITNTFQNNEAAIRAFLVKAIDGIISVQFDSMIKKYQKEFKR